MDFIKTDLFVFELFPKISSYFKILMVRFES